MTWLIGAMMVLVLWLILRQKQPTTEQILSKYKAREKARADRDHQRTFGAIRKEVNQDSQQNVEVALEEISSTVKESKLQEAQKLDSLHEEFRKKNKKGVPNVSKPIKRDISRVKLRELVKIVNGQEDVARRLIEGNLSLFPDKSPDWACDKAISDIERDRR